MTCVNFSRYSTFITGCIAGGKEHMRRNTGLPTPITIRIALIFILMVGVVFVQFSANGTLKGAFELKRMSIVRASGGSYETALVAGIVLLIVPEVTAAGMVGITTAYVTFIVATVIINAFFRFVVESAATRTP